MTRSASEVDQLFGLPPGKFTRARSALAARLQKAGKREEAQRVKALPKPPLPVWAINQAARRDRLGVERLIRAVEAVRRGQLGEGGPVAEAVEGQQRALRELRDGAAEILKAGGMKATTDTLERVSRSLLGAAVNAPEDLRHGRLTAEVPLPGFEALTGATPKVRRLETRRPKAANRREEKRLRERVERARATLRAAEAQAGQTEKRAAELEQEAEQARKAAEAAARAEQRAREDAEKAASRIREAAQELEEAERAMAKGAREK